MADRKIKNKKINTLSTTGALWSNTEHERTVTHTRATNLAYFMLSASVEFERHIEHTYGTYNAFFSSESGRRTA